VLLSSLVNGIFKLEGLILFGDLKLGTFVSASYWMGI
jgi:hypothetical protein